MSFNHRTHYLDDLYAALSTIFSPFQYVTNSSIDLTNFIIESTYSNNKMRSINNKLHQKNLKYAASLQQYNNLLYENSRLRKLLNTTTNIKYITLVADVIKSEQDPYRRQIIINRGKNDGIFLGQTVIDEYGILGQVSQVNFFTSRVVLISDLSHLIPVKIVRNGLRSIAKGTGSSKIIELLYIQNDSDVKVGDLLVASGLGGKFPKGYPIAKIISIKKKASDPFYKIKSLPIAQLDKSQEVLLIFKSNEDPKQKTITQRTKK